MARTTVALLLVACFFHVAVARKPLATAPVKMATFYDALVADKANHNLILSAIAKDNATIAMLKSQLNVTAFVPTDKAFIQAALKFKLGFNTAKLMQNSCLISAILKYHIVAPGMKLDRLKTQTTKNTLLVTNAVVNGQPTTKKVVKALKFKPEGGNVRVFAGATNGVLVAPKNVIAGKGVMHNIDTVLLPTTNITLLQQMTGCTAVL